MAFSAVMLAVSLAGAYASHRQQQTQMKKYNAQVSAQNKLLSDQYADKQRVVNTAKDEQARQFEEMARLQDEEFKKQSELSKQKAQLFQDTVSNPEQQLGQREALAQGEERRNQLFTDTAQDLPGSFGASNGSVENRVIRDLAAKSSEKAKEEAADIVGAQNRLSAYGDASAGQSNLFSDLSRGVGDIRQQSEASSRALSSRLRSPEYRMGALSSAMGEAAQSPYFRGQEPVYRTPNTLFADLLQGVGKAGYTYGMYQPKPGAGV